MTLDEGKRKSEELKSLIDKTTDTAKLNRYLSQLDSLQVHLGDAITKTDEWKNAYQAATIKISGNVQETNNLFENLFADFKEGFDDVSTKFNEFIQMGTSLGTNIQFWREYGQRVRQVGIEYGVSIKDLEKFRDANIDVERSFVETGLSAQEYRQGLESFFNTTDRLTQITPEFGKNLGNISQVLGMTSTDSAKFLGSMNNLNVGFDQSVKILEDLRFAAEKSALNTNKVLKIFTENFEKLNTYSFSRGVQGMQDMVKQSVALKVNMDRVLEMSDKFTDPEQTMEFASSMQMLGGSFAQLGDFNQLMYDAAVAPEELTKNIANATASLGSFNRETGKLDLSYADRLQMKEFSKLTNMSMEELNRMSSAAAKLRDIKMTFSMRPLTEEQENVIASMAQFDSSRGEYTVKVGGETKSIATLSDEDIKAIAAEKEKTTLEEQRVAKMDVGQLAVAKLEAGKYGTPDFFKMSGLDNEEFRKSINTGMDVLSDTLHEGLKKNLFKPLENLGSQEVGGKAKEVLDNLTKGITDFVGTVKSNAEVLIKMLPEPLQKQYEDLKKGQSTTKNEEGSLLPSQKYEVGTVLSGPSHSQGGIPFTVDGKPGFEAEGGEVILTKGVSQDPILLSIASKLNEVGGGKKLFEQGDIIKNINSNITSNYDNLNQRFEKEDIVKNINSLLTTNYDSLNQKFEQGDVIKTSDTSVSNNQNVLEKKIYEQGDILKNEISSINSNYTALNNSIKEGNVIKNQNENKSLNSNYNVVNKKFEEGDVLGNQNISSVDNSNYNSVTQKFEEGDVVKNVSSLLSSKYDILTQKFEEGDVIKNINSLLSSNYNTVNKKFEEGDVVKNNSSDYNVSSFVTNMMKSDMVSSIRNTTEELSATVNNMQQSVMNTMTTIGDFGRNQGGLIEKRGDIMGGTIGVNGSVQVDGKVSFDPIKITIDGTTASKEVVTNEEMQKQILQVVEDKIKNMNLYTQFINKKGTGINDGKLVNIPGITTDIG
jgi:hypothetical protein